MYYIVTRYARPGRPTIRHIYGMPDGSPYPTRSKALSALKRHKAQQREFEGVAYDQALADGTLEVNVVKVVRLDG